MPTKEQKSQADWLAAFGEPTRLALVLTLVTGPHTVTQLTRAIRVEAVNVSHHLQLLKQAGVVNGERAGRSVIYGLVGAKVTGTVLELPHPSGARVRIPLA